ncbi:DUF2157 domain-containing protein [Saccharopolyspora sp. HNM0983]|uniref:DUF2157 domain-containing protein n=1 Tax=Saccharopolyspora montiporae TaxID=2781240 RepID=A0A929FYH0_9PSEU|nr:DUF2157 domain-containing protein [Saccharopolyspora sp. HNM0983]MBE9373475.1 DUF2157 domain-containing protein [Saccharopolyspora sp. HNM0983]
MSRGLSAQQRSSIDDLVAGGELTAEQGRRVLSELDRPDAARPHGGVWELLGYLGGALVLGGALLLFGLNWAQLGDPGKILLLALAAVLLLGAGTWLGGGPRGLRSLAPGPRARIVAVLFALAAPAAAGAVDVAAGGVAGELPWSATGTALALAGYLLLGSVPGVLVTWAFGIALAAAVLDQVGAGEHALVVSAVFVLLGALWVVLGRVGAPAGRTAVVLGVLLALVGAQWPASEGGAWGYALTACVALACLAATFVRRDPVLLTGGVVGMTVAVPEAVWDWTGGALSAPLIVLIAGTVLLAVGGAGLQWHGRRG